MPEKEEEVVGVGEGGRVSWNGEVGVGVEEADWEEKG